MRVLGVIPARGGSKGVPRKNIRPLAGKPLLCHTANVAWRARTLARVIVSTDDTEIATVARRFGLDVPFLRPAELARDDTPTLPVVQHALHAAEATDGIYDAVCLLQPTNPLRSAADIDGCVGLLERSGADSVLSILRVPAEHNPHWVYFRAPDGALQLSTGEAEPIPRRQELPTAYHRDGSIYVTRRHVLLDGNSLYGARVVGYEVDPARTVNIDTMDDWTRAEALLGATAPIVVATGAA